MAKDVLSKHPDNINLHFFLATMYMHMGKYDLAEHFLNEAERLAPNEGFLASAREILATLRVNAATSNTKSSAGVGKLHQAVVLPHADNDGVLPHGDAVL